MLLIAIEGKMWVMTDLRDSWRKHNCVNNERYFYTNSNIDFMLAKRPNDFP